MRKLSSLILISVATATLAACAPEPSSDEIAEIRGEDKVEELPTVVGLAADNNDFSTLNTAIGFAGLGEDLIGEGPFTVFAPTNAAFEKVGAAKVDELLDPENKDELRKILTYHVVSGKMTAADVAKAITDGDGSATLTTMQGEPLKAMMDGDKVVLEDAAGNKSMIATTDMEASNGVVHAVDSVLMPS